MDMVEQRCQADNIAARIATLIQQCKKTGRCSAQDEIILNAIDVNITEILLWVERNCKRAKGPHDWSSLLANAGRMVIAAKWSLSNIIHGRTPIPPHVPQELAISKAKTLIMEAYKTLCKVQKNARRIRETFLEDRAKHIAETREIVKAAALRQLFSAERSSSIVKRLGIWFQSKEYTMLDRMLIPDNPSDLTNTTWSTVIEAQVLFEVLTKDCQEHFYQAAETPFITGPVMEKIGPFADNKYCDAVLDGTFDFTDIEEITEVKDLIRGMQYPDPTNPTQLINSTIDAEGLTSAISHTHKRTSSSPSG
jgi:hypothetical protein